MHPSAASPRGRRLVVGIVGLVAMAFVLSACLGTSGNPRPLHSTVKDGPDPAAVRFQGHASRAQIFTTESSSMHIPSWTFDFATGKSSGSYHDALPVVPAWSNGTRAWAPTVRYVSGRYLMMWSGSPKNGGHNCIGAATSSKPDGVFTPVTTGDFANGWCSTSASTAFLDPSLSFDTTGNLWLHYSRQTYSGARRPAGDIYAVRLSSNGLTHATSPVRLLTFDAVASRIETCGLGPAPRLENPALVLEQPGHYDLLLSLGTWTDRCYSTVQVPCETPTGPCRPENGGVVNLQASTRLTSTGGASLLDDIGLEGNAVVFHGFEGTFDGRRQPYWDTTGCVGCD